MKTICRICKNEFELRSDLIPKCDVCFYSEEEAFKLARLTLIKHPNVTIRELCFMTGIEFSDIRKYVKAGLFDSIKQFEDI